MTTTTAGADGPAHHASGFRFLVAAFCFLLVLVNYLDRVVISFAIKPIESDLNIQDGAFGLLMSAFAIVEPPASVVSVARSETVPPKVVSACVLMMRSGSPADPF